jgi:hypothetical protein
VWVGLALVGKDAWAPGIAQVEEAVVTGGIERAPFRSGVVAGFDLELRISR